MRIVTWNVRFGGKHELKAQIAEATVRFGADVIVITEARLPNPRGDLIKELDAVGWKHTLLSPLTDARQLGVLVLSKTPITPVEDLLGPEFMPYRHVAFTVEGFDMEIMGLYIPPVNARNDNARLFWQWMGAGAPLWKDRPLMIVGDLNSGIAYADEQFPDQLQFTHAFNEMIDTGFVDAYRHFHPREKVYSWWWHNGSGMRLDHCLVAPSCAHRLAFADYVVAMGKTRLVKVPGEGRFGPPGLSDHAAMLVDFDSSPFKR